MPAVSASLNAVNVPVGGLVFNQLVSRMGASRVLTVPVLDFSQAVTYAIDLTASVANAQLTDNIQALFIDCSQNVYCDTFVTLLSGQTIVAKAGSQGYYPILSTGANIFTVTSYPLWIYAVGFGMGPFQPGGSSADNAFPLPLTNTSSVSISFLNVPFVASQWQAVPQRLVTLSSRMQTLSTGYDHYNIIDILANTQIEVVNASMSCVPFATGADASTRAGMQIFMGDGNVMETNVNKFGGMILNAQWGLPNTTDEDTVNFPQVSVTDLGYVTNATTSNPKGSSLIIESIPIGLALNVLVYWSLSYRVLQVAF